MPGEPACPRCASALVRSSGAAGWRCPGCSGCALTVATLRRFAPAERVNALWAQTWRKAAASPEACPACASAMQRVSLDVGSSLQLDACRACQLVWFDGGELAALSPERQEPIRAVSALRPDAARALGEAMAAEIADDARRVRRYETAARVLGTRHRRGPGAWIVDALLSHLSG